MERRRSACIICFASPKAQDKELFADVVEKRGESIKDLLPAEKASAEAALSQGEVGLAKTIIRAGVAGRVEQFALRVGEAANPLMRPAGVVLTGCGRGSRGRQRITPPSARLDGA